ncbi:endoglucanase [Virgisporangium aliadipatigenens]|uniref:Endoglucanase n=1 Tax=Virgisporangium aliadipatigenens TaxID=741659 RepID=A0A8J3YQT7_9ACTN|nr:glycoside hydrolase family 9 protein [Virgisporangium aliadipatigenens]GIJ49979.1 endoglucanase [Virgisporangium aliadipatigenens]
MTRSPFTRAALAGGLVGALIAVPPAWAEGPEQIVNGTFDNGTANWWSTANAPISVVDGELCLSGPGGTVNPWDVIVGQDNIDIVNGETYKLSFTAHASVPIVARVLVQNSATYLESLGGVTDPPVDTTRRTYEYTFAGKEDNPAGQFAFQVGGKSAEPFTFCFDDVSLTGGAVIPPYEPDTGPRVRVNQVGYLPNGPKAATLVTTATTPVAWQLKDATGTTVLSGRSTPAGTERTSGLNVHTVDFTRYTRTGTGYTLVADGETSHPFDLSAAPYAKLRTDALSVYYPWRSGIAIDDAIAPGYGRPAGHVGVSPNQGDTNVGCWQAGCDYTLDVSGGWYDAADHGKYVVNGGIAVHQLMSSFERTKTARSATPAKDGALRLPETGNSVPDVLDEARWELEFLLKMQVPAGKPLAGMAHHKVHDEAWTGIPLYPHEDPQRRFLHPPSTAATLNLAATAAQCARLFAPYDATFAARCKKAAETAYAAAKANPAVYAPGGADNPPGGGPYDDRDVSDEFYWAAAELYLTTGRSQYAADVMASMHHTADVWRERGFDWGHVAQLARLELATVPNALPDRERVRRSVVDGARKYLATQRTSPWSLTYAPSDNVFDWGSNQLVLNNLVVIATAFDLTNDATYRDAVVRGMDYLLGRNALNQSYVTGYGEHHSERMHSRWFAHSVAPAMPKPPVGSIAGGPNSASSTWDPTAADKLAGCVDTPQFCYIDDIQSWSTNEIAINWASALGWVAGFVADQGNGGKLPPAGACRVDYHALKLPGGSQVVALTVTNTGRRTVDGWTVEFAFTGGQRVVGAVGATSTQQGATLTLHDDDRLRPRGSATVLFAATDPVGTVAPVPELFRLNGEACG